MFKNLLIHHLALGAQPQSPDDIVRMTETALSLGAAGIELVFWPGKNIDPDDAAKAILKAGGKRASLCTFQPGGDFGDPLIPELRKPALKHIEAAIMYAYEMRHAGLRISTVDGPLAFVLGKQDNGVDAKKQVVEFMKLSGDVASRHVVTLALERLQESEDGVIRTSDVLRGIVESVGSHVVGAHEDTFHAQKNGESPEYSIRTLGKTIVHLHANGVGMNREKDGRIPCGCEYYGIDGKDYTDTINWDEVTLAVAELPQHANSILVCLEPFCEAACQAIPRLRTGVVPVTNIQQIRESVRNLSKTGLLLRA